MADDFDELPPHLRVVRDGDEEAVAEFNLRNQAADGFGWDPPDGYVDAAPDLGLPPFGSDDFTVWLDGPQPDRKTRLEDWKWWMKCRQKRSGKMGGRPVQAKPTDVKAADVIAKATDKAAEALADEMVKAAKLLEPFKAAAVAKLVSMMDSKDGNDRRFAVKTILEITDGKPAQTVIERQDGPRVIRYETTALMPELPTFVPGAGVDSPGDEISRAMAPLEDDDEPQA